MCYIQPQSYVQDQRGVQGHQKGWIYYSSDQMDGVAAVSQINQSLVMQAKLRACASSSL